MRKSINLSQFASIVRGMPKQVGDAVVRGVQSAGLRGVGIVIEEIARAKPHPAINTGELMESVRFRPTPKGGTIEVDAPQAWYIENGTRPHFPPLAPLAEWAMRKFSVDEKEARRIAYAVAIKIAETGIEPRHFFAKAMARIKGDVLAAEIESELNQL